MSTVVDTERPPGVPEGARLVTLAELRDRIAEPEGSLRIGPRRSHLRCRVAMWPLVLICPVAEVLGGGVSRIHGGRVFSLRLKRLSRWELWAFTEPGAAERELWIWDIEQERAWRKAGRP